MARELRCADLIPGCDFVAQGTHDSDVMKKTAEHAKRAHKMAAIAMEVEQQAREAIRDVAASLAAGGTSVKPGSSGVRAPELALGDDETGRPDEPDDTRYKDTRVRRTQGYLEDPRR